MQKPLLVLFGVALCLLGGCSKNARDADAKPKLGYLVKQPEEPWFQAEWKGAAQAGAKDGFEVVELGVTDGDKVLAAIDNLAALGAKGFVICTPDVRLGPGIMTRAGQDGLKVIAVDDQFVAGDGSFMTGVPYLGMSASRIGREVGTQLYKEMRRRGWNAADSGLCAITFEELATAKARTDSVIAALEEAGFPADRVFKGAQKTTDIPGSFAAANIVLTQHPLVKHWLICALNDTGVLGAVRATEDRGFTAEQVIGIGINGTDCIDELRKAKPTGFFGSMRVSARQEGYRTAELLYHWVHDGTAPPPDTRTTGVFMTRENLEQVLKDDGESP